jgi:hypothetical protein
MGSPFHARIKADVLRILAAVPSRRVPIGTEDPSQPAIITMPEIGQADSDAGPACCLMPSVMARAVRLAQAPSCRMATGRR